jgi:altronate hydrolase
VRNYIAVIATVNCATHVATRIARYFTPEVLAAYPNVDGVLPIVHGSGCALPPGGLSKTYLKRVLGNLDRNPNVAAAIYVGLGCEVMQLDDCRPVYTTEEMGRLGPDGFVIQDQGGFHRTVQAGIAAIERLLPQANAVQRQPVPLSNLGLALQCGGSDGWSGVTANPLMGRVVDAVVRAGGMAALAETPEIYGAEGLLLRRVTGEAVAEKLIERLNWWTAEAEKRGFSLDNNPAPGNKAGGLTNIFEKSLGAVAKAGSSPLNGVYEYGEWIDRNGLVFMDSPGNDPFSVTGQVGSGCNLVMFSTGRGSLFGSPLAPTIKLASNSTLYNRMPDDMDFNAGRVLEGESWEALTGELLQQVIAVASGQRTWSESHGPIETEFVPWQPDAVL